MSLGNHIRNLRKSKSMTLQQLAYLTLADAGNLSRIERGELGVNEGLLRKIAAALNTTPANLYAENDAIKQPFSVQDNVAQYRVSPIANNQQSPPHDFVPQNFVNWFRSAAPYIHAFGGRTFVIAFGGEIVDEKQFIALTHDLNLLASLEVRLVLVHGARDRKSVV